MTSSIKYADVITKTKNSYVFFAPLQILYQTAKFGKVRVNISEDNGEGKLTLPPANVHARAPQDRVK